MITEVIWFILKVILIVLLMTLMLHVTIKTKPIEICGWDGTYKGEEHYSPYYIYTAVEKFQPLILQRIKRL